MTSLLFLAVLAACSPSLAMRGVGRQDGSTLIEWDVSNPIFRIDNTEHVMDVRLHQQVHILCPKSRDQRYIIYNVNKEDYQTCRISDPNPTQVAVCTGGAANSTKRLFTITFRTFSPSPAGLEFQAGKDYYFITTSAPDDIEQKVGGRCQTHNMKVIFKVKGNRVSTSKFQRLNRKVHGRRQGDILAAEADNEVQTTDTRGRTSMFSRERFGGGEPNTMNGGRYEAYYPSQQDPGQSFRSRGSLNIKQEASRQHQSDQPASTSCRPHLSALAGVAAAAALWRNMVVI